MNFTFKKEKHSYKRAAAMFMAVIMLVGAVGITNLKTDAQTTQNDFSVEVTNEDLAIGAKKEFTVKKVNSAKHVITSVGVTSSDSDVAKVTTGTAKGTVTGVSEGTATITVSVNWKVADAYTAYETTKTGTYTYNFKVKVVTAVYKTASGKTVSVGDTITGPKNGLKAKVNADGTVNVNGIKLSKLTSATKVIKVPAKIDGLSVRKVNFSAATMKSIKASAKNLKRIRVNGTTTKVTLKTVKSLKTYGLKLKFGNDTERKFVKANNPKAYKYLVRYHMIYK